MVSVGQPSITVIIIFKCSNNTKTRGRTKGKLLRIALVVEQKENGFSRPAQLSPSTSPTSARSGKNIPHGFLIWTKSTYTRSTGQGRKTGTILYCVYKHSCMNKKQKASNLCFSKIEFWTQIKVGSKHENSSSFCNQTICWYC